MPATAGCWTIAYKSTNGTTLWSRNYTVGTDDQGKSLAVSPDGSKVFVTGQSNSGHYDYVTIAYDTATGNRLWLQRFNSTANNDDIPSGVVVSPDGSKVFVTGTSVGASSGKDYATLAYNASTGAQLWVMRFNATANADDSASALAASPDGSKVFVTGQSTGSGTGLDYATLGYNSATGARLWVMRFNGSVSGNDAATGIAVSPDSSKVFVTGEAGVAGGWDSQTLAYDAPGGTQLWSKPYGPSIPSFGYRASLAVSPDGTKVYVATPVGGTSTLDFGTVAFTASSGSQLWSASYNGSAALDDTPNAIAASPDGSRVFVTGASGGSGTGKDFATLAYDSYTGHWLWTRRNNGAANGDDIANAVAVSPDSTNVAVAGSSVGSGTALDWSVIDYASG